MLESKSYYRKQYLDGKIKPIANMVTCNYGGFAVVAIDSEEVVFFENYCDGEFTFHKCKLYYGEDDTYFKLRGAQYSISGFMRI